MKKAVVILVLLALVAAGGYFAAKNGAPANNNGNNSSGNGSGFKIVPGSRGHRILLEAEGVTEIELPFSLARATGQVAAGASGGKCVYLGPEKVNEKPETRKFKRGHPQAKHPGFVRYKFTVPWTGKYALWLRAFWVDDCGDSVLISINDSAPQTISGSTYGRWLWNCFKTGTGEPAWLQLEKGKTYTLTICNREDDLYLDQIMLRSGDRSWPDPLGIEKNDPGSRGGVGVQ